MAGSSIIGGMGGVLIKIEGWEGTDELIEGGMECQVIRGKRGDGNV